MHFDNGGEYVSKPFQDFCNLKGIKRELTAPYNPPQNGVVERMHQMIQEKVHSMLSNVDLPNGFWAEALATAVHLINRSPNKVLDTKVPEEVWSGKPPSYKHLRVFGCEAYCHISKEFRDKLAPKSKKSFFLAMENLARWDSGYGIQRLERLCAAMMCSSMKKRCIRSLLRQWKYVEWYFKKMDKCIIDRLHKLNSMDKMLPWFKKVERNNRFKRFKLL